MNRVYTIIFLLSLSIATQSQTKKINAGGIEIQVSSVDTSLNNIFCQVGIMPQFPGGMSNLVAFAKRKIKYPKTAVNDNVQGSVMLQFVVNEKGKVTGQKIVQPVRKDLDSVCLRMLHQMPKWKPGQLNGKAIAVNERWKITFVLTK